MVKKVNVLVVTFNRKECLINLLHALERQTYPIQKILIFDNYSSDLTYEELILEGYCKENVRELECSSLLKNNIEVGYYRNDQNEGGSGGFHKGMSLALEQRGDYIWCMDDDVLPKEDCLENLVKYISPQTKIYVPTRTDEYFQDRAIINVDMKNPFKYSVRLRTSSLCNDQINEDTVSIRNMPFEGPLIAVELVKKIGLPRKDLFIIFDDTDYAFRTLKVTNIKYVKTAIMHKQIIPIISKEKKMNWKNYYYYRNQYWFDRNYGENKAVKVLRPILNHLRLFVGAIVNGKWANIKIINAAFYDGTHDILGKTVEPGTEFIRIK